jgi:hypothetical protein
MTLGYTGGVVRLPHPHAFAINGHAYHQIHSADTKGYPGYMMWIDVI